jgi:bacteriocin biosynthesis cyclodehydratase domain-containing protein
MNESLQLRLGDEVIVVLEGAPRPAIEQVLALLDGSRTPDELIDAVGRERAPLVESLLGELDREGLLLGLHPPGRTRAGLVPAGEVLGRGPLSSDGGPPRGRVALIGHQPLTTVIAEALSAEEMEVELLERHDPSRLTKVTTLLVSAAEQPDLSLLEECNQWAVAHRTAALFVNLSHGEHATIGPFYVPGDSACYRCWHRRLLENTASPQEQLAFDEAQRQAASPLRGRDALPSARSLIAALVALEARAFFTDFQPVQTVNGTLTVDLAGLRTWREPCWRVPWCDVCGE